MAELIQHILSLPNTTQLAIMQAILANMQASEENDSTLTEESQKYQLERIGKILTEIEAGEMNVYSREEAWAKIDSQKSARKGA